MSHRVTERFRESLTTMVVPAIERICAQLFKQLNDNFRHGLDQVRTGEADVLIS